MRALNAHYDGAEHGVFTDRPETLSNDFFKTVVDMSIAWAPVSDDAEAKFVKDFVAAWAKVMDLGRF
ncbi:hypothetical protein [Alloalcanivorax marinus]|uniref:hypothetical protein n=1 Tax=Alloalcanivorax marinus TaxID=1177169 RepID=UPI001933D0B4|nr:hypothetical protein [Alloalcanivorax marinus]MBL7252195.1 hypothetical protein [Alloalcanivorax marinus]